MALTQQLDGSISQLGGALTDPSTTSTGYVPQMLGGSSATGTSTSGTSAASSSFWEELLGSGSLAAAMMAIAGDIQGYGDTAYSDLMGLADTAISGTAFTPYSVRGHTGSASVDENGELVLGMNDNYAALMDYLVGGSSSLFGEANQSIDELSQQIFDESLAAAQVGFDQDRMELEQRQFAQGRGGITTAEYGGTPESYALEKAIADATLQLSVDARDQALEERAASGELADLFLQDSFAGETALLGLTDPSIALAQLGQAGDIAGQSLAAQLGLGGVNAQLSSDLTASNMYGQMFTALSSLLGGAGGIIDDQGFSGLWDQIIGAFG